MKKIGDRFPMLTVGQQDTLEYQVELIVSNDGKPLGAVVKRIEHSYARKNKEDEILAEREWMLVNVDGMQIKRAVVS